MIGAVRALCFGRVSVGDGEGSLGMRYEHSNKQVNRLRVGMVRRADELTGHTSSHCGARLAQIALASVALGLALAPAPAAAAQAPQAPMYRLYNRWSGEHLFTGDAGEYASLGTIGWAQEGEAWESPTGSGDLVYRLYNPYSGDHLYTGDAAEYASLPTVGWRQEGVAFRSAAASGGTPIYRLFNPYATVGTHLYTTDAGEYESLGALGWRREGVAFYASGRDAGWDETVVDSPAWDETVVDTPAWDETVVDTPAWDEQVSTRKAVYVVSADGSVWDTPDEAGEHAFLLDSSYHDEWRTVTETVHHDATYRTVHHEAVTHVVHHEAVTHVVHHEATYGTVHHGA